ncbi:hypothetical protein N9996_04145 [Synechococcus sp. AH-603-M21]|nr:hypothetical protein [Synechococcus sp. AH-603-M21]|tara:strand:- start:152 stop:571 length:420 start_codon:yes stop_codon:yes gene_type:complete
MMVSFLSAMMFWNKIARWSLFAVVWTLPLRAMALEPVRYRCGSLGEVSVDRSRAHPTKAVVVYGDQRWSGTMSGGSMTFFSPISQTPESPWMNFGRNGVWLYTNYVGTAGWSEFWAEDAASYRRQHPDFLESSCVIVSP